MQNIFGLKRRKGYVLSRLVQGIVILGVIIYIASFIFSFYSYFIRSHNDLHFTNEKRTVIISMLYIPLFLSFLVICFYEKLHPKKPLNNKLIISLLFFQMFLLIPFILFTFRYSDLFKVISIISLLSSFILFFVPNQSDDHKGKLYNQILFVYWTVWLPECNDIDNSHFSTRIKMEKEEIYTDNILLKTFQEHFIPYSRESEFIGQFLKNNNSYTITTNNIKMLDIGGYNGEFTAQLLNQLKLQVSSIEVVDPINKENLYKLNLHSQCVNINFLTHGFEKYSSYSLFDFILASHSLYSCIDNQMYDNNEKLIIQLLSFLNNTGLIIVILGNSKGKAYSLKKELYRLVLNEETRDTNSCEFEEELKKRKTELDYKKITIDNYIEIDKILKNEQTLKEWVSYFARVPIIKDKHIVEGVKDLFNIFSIKYSNLPEETKNLYTQFKEDINLLSHKTDAFFIKKKQLNARPHSQAQLQFAQANAHSKIAIELVCFIISHQMVLRHIWCKINKKITPEKLLINI